MLTSTATSTPTVERRVPREDFVPETFDQMYAHYYPYVVKLVGRFGITYQDAEDVAQIILTKFFEKDALSDFDVDYRAEQERAQKAMFRTFLSGFVKAYVRHYINRQRITQRREGVSTDAIMTIGFSDGPVTWLELNDPGHEDQHIELEDNELLHTIRTHLDSLPTSAQQQCSLRTFFEAVVVQTRDGGKLSTQLLAEEFGVTKTSINNWLRKLRAEIYTAIEES